MSDDNNSKDLSKERYSRYARAYVTSPGHARGADLEKLVALAAPQPGWRVLDVATGGGHTALKFAPLTGLIVASDLTEKMLATARAFIRPLAAGKVQYCVADAEGLPFRAGVFDLVTCRIAPHHFPDPARFMQEAARVLCPGGLVLVQDHLLPDDLAAGRSVDDFERRRDPSHRRAFNRQEWLAMFAAAGLVVQAAVALAKRHEFREWVERQGGTDEDLTELEAMLTEMPPAAQVWLQPQNWSTPQASFANHHLIVAGRKQ